jgi:hypothetical protein
MHVSSSLANVVSARLADDKISKQWAWEGRAKKIVVFILFLDLLLDFYFRVIINVCSGVGRTFCWIELAQKDGKMG